MRLRLTRFWQKLLFVVGYVIVLYLLTTLSRAAGFSTANGNEDVSVVIIGILQLGMTYFGTRIFRTRNEPVESPRAWWRATGRPLAGWLLGVLWLLSSFASVIPLRRPDGVLVSRPIDIPNVVIDIVMGVFYVQSSVRLQRHPDLIPPRFVRPAVPLRADRRPER